MLRARTLENKPRRVHTTKVRIEGRNQLQTSYQMSQVLSSRMRLYSLMVLYIKARSKMAGATDMVSKYGPTEQDTKASGSTTLHVAGANSSTLMVMSMMVSNQKP